VRQEFKAAGWRLTKKFDFLPHQYCLIFERDRMVLELA
jgi:hypothetical protein